MARTAQRDHPQTAPHVSSDARRQSLPVVKSYRRRDSQAMAYPAKPHQMSSDSSTDATAVTGDPSVEKQPLLQYTETVTPQQWQYCVCNCCPVPTAVCLPGALCGCCPPCGLPCMCCNLHYVYSRETNGVGGYNPQAACTLCMAGCCGCMYCCFVPGMRRTLIQRYDIQGEAVCTSCLLGLLCHDCSLCQMRHEMSLRGDGPGGCCLDPAPPRSTVNTSGKDSSPPVAASAWSTDLCYCADAIDCLESAACYPCLVASVAGYLNAQRGAPCTEFDCCSCLCVTASMPFLFRCCVIEYMLRREVIERYNIEDESPCKTCCLTALCSCFVTPQVRREMGVRGEWPGGCCHDDNPMADVMRRKRSVIYVKPAPPTIQ